jgi:phage shock protein PspC (stress-responsive transcriptional regulator)
MSSQIAQSNEYVALPLRAHTILGVCEAIGEDFGFNPLWLRVPLAASVLISPTYAIGAYFLLGIAVLVSRLVFPRPKAENEVRPATVDNAQAAPNENIELPLAA